MNIHSIRSLQVVEIPNIVRDPTKTSWLIRLRGALDRLRRIIGKRHRISRGAADLARMDDRMLRDIGISRLEIAYAVGGSFRHVECAREHDI